MIISTQSYCITKSHSQYFEYSSHYRFWHINQRGQEKADHHKQTKRYKTGILPSQDKP